ncbi:MAG TPA: hypothetical protein PKA27_01195, partial [Fimbriimonadaceae bacterium]|nr:hypothetical protein [Fimbriimonadaceae bacterium]
MGASEQVGVLRFGPNPFTSFTDFPPRGKTLGKACVSHGWGSALWPLPVHFVLGCGDICGHQLSLHGDNR